MRKILLLLSLIFLIGGCAWLGEQKANVDACRQDAECWNEAVEKAKSLSNQAGDLASLSGLPWAATAVKPIVGYGSLVVLLAMLGSKLKKNTQPTG